MHGPTNTKHTVAIYYINIWTGRIGNLDGAHRKFGRGACEIWTGRMGN